MSAACIAQMPEASSEESTTKASPVRSRWNSAAANPAASASPVWQSPNPGDGTVANVPPGRVSADAAPLRNQYVLSKPPSFAWTPFGP